MKFVFLINPDSTSSMEFSHRTQASGGLSEPHLHRHVLMAPCPNTHREPTVFQA